MRISAIFDFLLLAGAIHGFLFIMGTFLLRKKIEKPVLFLNLFVLFLSLNNFQSWLMDKELVFVGPFMENFIFPWNILIVPMFYAFLVYFLGIEKKRWPFLKFSIVFFVVALVARAYLIKAVSNQTLEASSITDYNNLEDFLALAYSIFLYVKSIRLVFKYQQLYPNVLKFDNLKWIRLFLKLGGIVFVFWTIAILFNTFSSVFDPPYTYYPLRLSSSILIYWVGYQGFFRYVTLKNRIALRADLKKSKKYTRFEDLVERREQNLSKSKETFGRIHNFILENKRYLDPHLSLETLGGEVNMGTSSLSKLINENVQGNFPDYINQLRVEEAKKILLNPEFGNYTIASIGLECGFNSKSSFYTAFGKTTGKTPTVFRKETN
ncbi:helix-turn-helix domain-containing protein [Flagellimonas myxillae]|uniref:helix-turn-helix domain-containing protein n=1 Tax=Flagellimonas myxillae TaxID=2942214 RepID=UPI00201EF6BB|nr:AraC family transcriptional regulator [Muricauda myxillae]MCL6266929.1 AraC family transcriptional regulator [Muricauda myxillae]